MDFHLVQIISGLVQSNEVPGSTHMELKGLKRGLKRLENAGLHIENLFNDRHGMMRKYMQEDHQCQTHFFDVWHECQRNCMEIASKK